MAVQKKEKSWYIRGKLKREDGSLYQYTKKAEGCRTKKEALEFERQFRLKWQDIEFSKNDITVAELVKEFMLQRKDVKTSTIVTDQVILDKLVAEHGEKKINLIKKKTLQNSIDELQKKYSFSYVQKWLYNVRKVFRYAITQGYIESNPCDVLVVHKKKDEVKKEMNFFEPEEFNIFIEYVQNQQMKDFFTFLYFMGTRKGEAMALTWDDVDLEKRTVSISKTLTNKTSDGPYAITSPKTSNSIRVIIIPQVVVELLERKRDEAASCVGFSESCFVFGFDKPLAAETIRKNLKRSLAAANKDGHNLKDMRVHDFRHSHVSYLVNNMGEHKFSDYEIAQRLGDTVETIQSTYAHMFKGAQEKIVEFINRDTTKEKSNPTSSSCIEIDVESLIKLKQLLDMGIITQEEFNLKKKQMLGI